MLLLLALTGCFLMPSEEDEPVEPAPPAPRVNALVWTATPSGEPPLQDLLLRTRWVRVDPSGVPEVLGEHDGLVYAADDGLRRVDATRTERPGRQCDRSPGTNVERSLLWRRGDAPAVVIDPLALDPELPAEEPYEWIDAVSLDAQVGPWLFVHAVAMDHGCGAHPNTEHAARVIDLRSGEPFEVLKEPSVWAPVQALREAALQPLTAARPNGMPAGEAAEAGELEVARLVPRWTPEGLVVAAQFAAATCYACSDGSWSSYTVSETTDLAQVPTVFTPWSERPPWLDALGPVDGWSFVNEATLPDVERLFGAVP